MSRTLARIRKLARSPRLFFGDMITKRLLGEKGGIGTKAGRLLLAIVGSPEHPGPRRYYVENYSKLSVDPGSVLFDAFWGRKIGCHPYAIYRAMRLDPRFAGHRYVWVLNSGVSAPEDVRTDTAVRFVEHATKEHAEALLQAGTIIHNSNLPPYFNKKPGQLVIATWHGVPLKTLGFDANPTLAGSANTQRNFLFSDHIVVAGDYARDKTIISYGASAVLDRARRIGSPRVDLTLKGSSARIRRDLGVEDGRQVLLFAPTWRGAIGSVSNEVADQIAAVAALERSFADTHHILVSLHHLTRKALANQRFGAQHVPDDVDINEILAATDILVSDYSSILIDFLALDRPIVLYAPDREQYENERGLYLPLERLPAAIATDLPGLEAAVREARAPSSFAQCAEMRALLIPNEDGEASARCLQYVLDRDSLPKRADRGKLKLVIHPGGLANNGITSSFLSLVSSLDHERMEVFVVVSDAELDQDPDRYENFRRIDPRCKLLIRTGTAGVPAAVEQPYRAFIKGDASLDDEQLAAVTDVFDLEARRVFCGLEFDYSIDFSGYSPFWAMLMGRAPARQKIIYQHSDMLTEAENPKRNKTSLKCVFQAYRHYDRLISVSAESYGVNSATLTEYVADQGEFSFAKNVISPLEIQSKASVSLSSVAPQLLLSFSDPALFKFVAVGRLSPEKNHSRLLRAFSRIVGDADNAVLVIVGSGPMESELCELARELRISDRVVFVGQLANPFPVLKRADCLVMPSDYEGQGLVLLEALTLNVPCISTDFPSARGIIREGDGLICAKSSVAMAAAMRSMLSWRRADVQFDPEAYLAGAMQEFHANVLALPALTGQEQVSTTAGDAMPHDAVNEEHIRSFNVCRPERDIELPCDIGNPTVGNVELKRSNVAEEVGA